MKIFRLLSALNISIVLIPINILLIFLTKYTGNRVINTYENMDMELANLAVWTLYLLQSLPYLLLLSITFYLFCYFRKEKPLNHIFLFNLNLSSCVLFSALIVLGVTPMSLCCSLG